MSRRDAYIEHLSRVPLFSQCSKKELTAIARCGTDLRFSPGRVMVEQGRRGYEFFVIVDGKASVTRDGQEVATLGPGDYFGELALLDAGPRDATVTATTDLQAIVVGAQEFRALLEETPNLTHKLLAGMAKRLRELDTRTVV